MNSPSCRVLGSWKRWQAFSVCVFLLLAIALVFGQTVHQEFVNLDDNVGVSENSWVTQGLTWQGIRWAFSNRLIHNFTPLTWISHMAVWELYCPEAGGHHLVNVLLHAVTTLLLFLVLRQMTASTWPSALAAALWAIHPLRVESVAWVTERKDCLSGLFFALTLWTYLAYLHRRSWWARCLMYLAVMVLYALGLLSKPMLATLPCVLLLLDYWPLKRMGPPWSLSKLVLLILEKLPLLAMAAAACARTVWAESVAEYPSRGLWWTFGNGLLSYVVYLRQFFWPTDLAVLYPLRGPDLPPWHVLGAALVLLAVTAAALVWRRKCPYLLVGWLWFLGMLLPVVGFVPFGNEGPADRFTYLPQIGLCMAVAWGAAVWCRGLAWRRWVCSVASASAIAALMVCAWQQTSYWHDSETLWKRTLACTKDNYWVHSLLGNTLALKGRTSDAIEQFQKALSINPHFLQGYFELGVAEAKLGQFDEAMASYRRAIVDNNPQSNPHYVSAQNNLGYILSIRGEPYEALEHIEEALRVKPDLAEAHYNHGFVLHSLGHFRMQSRSTRKPCELKPNYAEPHFYLALVYEALGRRADAIEQYREALKIKPDLVEARNGLDRLLKASGQ